jgi:hypothetical protein
MNQLINLHPAGSIFGGILSMLRTKEGAGIGNGHWQKAAPRSSNEQLGMRNPSVFYSFVEKCFEVFLPDYIAEIHTQNYVFFTTENKRLKNYICYLK